MKNKKKPVIIGVLLLVFVLFIGFGVSHSSHNMDNSDSANKSSSAESGNSNGSIEEKIGSDSKSDNETDDKSKNKSKSDDGISTESNGNKLTKSEIFIGPPLYNSSSSDEQEVTVSAQEKKAVQFPYKIPGSNLTIDSIRSYDGIFIENGEDVPVNGIATLFITNNGSKDYDLANIKLIGDGIEYNFSASGIGAGKQIAIQESNAQAASSGPFYTVDSETSQETSFTSDSDISYTLNDDGSIELTNNSSSNKPVVRVYYKFYLPEYSAYIGGITYTAKVDNLEAGETRTISPSHFDSETSEIIRIQSYNE